MNDIKGIIEDVEKSSLVSDKVIKKVIEIIGQEKWQEIYDEESDICTTTGELIITLKGFPYLEEENNKYLDVISNYEVKVADLEKENEKLKNRNAELKGMYAHSAREAGTYKQFFEQLKKENAELKAELEENKDLPAVAYQQGAEWWKKKTEKKLAQAKEIIKEFVYHYNNKTIYVNNVKPLLEQAEQFLKGEDIILEE